MLTTSALARMLDSSKSENKAARARKAGKKGGAWMKPLEDIACSSGGAGLERKSTRGRAQATRHLSTALVKQDRRADARRSGRLPRSSAAHALSGA